MKDKYEGVVDAFMPINGLEIFRWWYGQANLGAPSCNVWQHDFGKLVVPIVYRDIDLLGELIERYDPITQQVMDIKGRVFLKIGAGEIRESFSLTPDQQVTHEIDFNSFDRAFGKIGQEPKKRLWLSFFKEVDGVRLPYEAMHNKAHLTEHYNETLVNTHTALYQVLGLKNENKFSMITMWICWGYQRTTSNPMILNLPIYLNTPTNEGLTKIKNKERGPFRFYSFLMLFLLFQNKDYLSEVIDLELERDGVKFPIQLWTTILSQDWEGANATMFINYFSYNIRQRLKGQTKNFPPQLLCFLMLGRQMRQVLQFRRPLCHLMPLKED